MKKINFATRITIRIDTKDIEYLQQNTDNISEFIRKAIRTAIEQKKSLKKP